MKTNKATKLMSVFLTALTLFCLTTTVFAGTESGKQGEKTKTHAETSKQSAPAPEKPGHKDGKNHPARPMKYDNNRFEDWFEDRIDTRKHNIDFNKLPENPTDKEMLEFFIENFMGEASRQKTNAKPERPMKKDRKADRFEDWFEDRIDEREHRVDFSQLGENPTDEEIVEFFRNNFMGDNASRKTDKSGKPCGEQKDAPRDPGKPETEPAPKAEPVPESIESAPENIEPAPVEQPTEEGAEQAPAEDPTAENVKDKA